MRQRLADQTTSGTILSALPLAAIAVAVGLVLRLAFAATTPPLYDAYSYDLVVAILRRGGNVYAETERYNYAPIWAWCLLGLDYIARWIDVPLHRVVRGALAFVDVINGVLVGLIGARQTNSSTEKGAWRYLLNPVPIIIIGMQGQFDTLAALPLLFAIWISSGQENRSSIIPLWLLGASTLLVKHIALFQVWCLFLYVARSRRQLVLLMGGALSMWAASFLPFLPAGWTGILDHVVTYGAPGNPYGLRALLPKEVGAAVFFGTMLLIPVAARYILRLALPEAMSLSTVALLALIFGFHGHYTLWPILFGAAFGGVWFWLYTIAFLLMAIGPGAYLEVPGVPSLINVLWFIAVGWTLSWFVTIRPVPSWRQRVWEAIHP